MNDSKDDKEIIFIALSNQILSISEILENSEKISPEEREMYEYILRRSEEIMEKTAKSISDLVVPMSKPKFD